MEEERESLVEEHERERAASSVGTSDGSHNAGFQDSTEPPAPGVQDDNDEEEGSSKASCCRNCVTSCLGGRLPEQRRLLVLNLIILLWTVATALVSLGEIYKKSYGQCLIGMALSEGGLDPRTVKMHYCKCPIYTLLLTGCIAWLSLMVNWVSDLHSKRPVFYKWLKWQAFLTFAGMVGIFGSAVMTLYGFIHWCDRLYQQLKENQDQDKLTYSSAPQLSKYLCYDNAKRFDVDHQDENQLVYLEHTFIFSLIISMLIVVHFFLWVAAFYYTIRILYVEPKDNFDPTAYQAEPRPLFPENPAGPEPEGEGEGEEAAAATSDYGSPESSPGTTAEVHTVRSSGQTRETRPKEC